MPSDQQAPDDATTPPQSVPAAGEKTDAAPAPRQTQSYLRNLMQGFGLRPKSKLGQNFLIDLNLLDLICRASDLGREDSVLEVGTGTGSLTAAMAEQAGCVLTVEVDHDFHKLARHVVGPRPNVDYFLGDALANKNALRPEVLTKWDDWTRLHGCTRRKLVANLPYVIATPVVSNLLLNDTPIALMTVMVQWEIGERMRATPGTKEYNALSVLVQSVADVEIVRKVGPTNFYPRPQVDSAIVTIRPDPRKREVVGDVRRFRAFLRDLYVHRRKNLRQALTGWPTGRKDKEFVDQKLKEIGIDGNVRAETLDPATHLTLSRVFGD